MLELRRMLDDAGIEWWDDSDPQLGIMRTKTTKGSRSYSVIFGPRTYGAPDGLLEMWDFVHDVTGWLTADEAFRIIDVGLRGYRREKE